MPRKTSATNRTKARKAAQKAQALADRKNRNRAQAWHSSRRPDAFAALAAAMLATETPRRA